ncbi:hypothetical protein COX93_02830 [Candidatus Nomurabacteria bacterium CG_4_10_14_0_2_um_filter_30_12]|uniref:Uncharacterized protein n=1 Tax=Candidatus Nomurabacteria bacterium CG_4_10_14_0_2_um_filter_30_12 TaxID=1974727 RepID=A0A2J0MF69_9BACT|nr:MAG: hypothetical protein COX93_02830 [Candidatus Nomurabacteria bacterium CG_4_10_14_0_2_um_filter_30_12]
MYRNKISHLEFIQKVINRLANNSFLIKGWCVTLVAALATLSSGTKDQYLIIAYLPVIIFCFLDTYYLWQERLYREYFEKIRSKKENDIDFSMIISNEILDKCDYFETFFSKAIMPFYLGVIGTVIVLMFLF